jgi:hydrogenase maturation protein HypF
LIGVAQVSTFEAEAAMRLEALASAAGDLAAIDSVGIESRGGQLVLDTVHLASLLFRDRQRGRPVEEIAGVFHESLARGIAQICVRLATEHGVSRAALSGGVFQNALLLARVQQLLRDHDLLVYTNEQIPANDGGVSLGQALVAACQTREAT